MVTAQIAAALGYASMGVLDDAIRDHLELKRQHGGGDGDPASEEIAALGPVGREPEVAAADSAPPAVSGPDPLAELDEASASEELALPVEAGSDGDAAPPIPAAPVAGDTPPRGFAAVADEDAPTIDEDILEETPAFLQETPEHDRLWFEQQAPRDFDLD